MVLNLIVVPRSLDKYFKLTWLVFSIQMRKSVKNNSEIRTAVDTNCLGKMIRQHSKGLLNLLDILIRKHYINYVLVFILRQKTNTPHIPATPLSCFAYVSR